MAVRTLKRLSKKYSETLREEDWDAYNKALAARWHSHYEKQAKTNSDRRQLRRQLQLQQTELASKTILATKTALPEEMEEEPQHDVLETLPTGNSMTLSRLLRCSVQLIIWCAVEIMGHIVNILVFIIIFMMILNLNRFLAFP